MQPRQPMLPSIASDLLQKQGSMNNSNFSWTHSKVSSRKRPFEEDDDFFAPPSKRREYSATRPFGLYNETTAGSASQTLQDSRNRVYPSGNRSFTPADGYVEINNSRTPANSDIYAGMVYQAAPSTPRGRAAMSTPGLVIQQKPVSTLTRGASSPNSAVAPNYRYRPQTSTQLPPLATLFTGFRSHESSPSSNNNYSMEPQNNVNHGNILSHHHSVPFAPKFFTPSRPDMAPEQNSNENSPVASPQEEDPIDRQETDSATLAEETPRQSIEAPDNFDNESVVSYHPSDNDDDENHSQLIQTTKEQSDKNTELRKEIRTLKAQASSQFAYYIEMTEMALKATDPSRIDDEKIKRLIQRSVEAGNKTADNATVNNADVLATLRREVTELQNTVLKMQNEALMKQVEELRALRDL
ncbi:uncharacterized protein EAF02_010087 [Botrytis sinoallii]|uniref:uncharacterized protein n=1 Tax=Botrytis sinoallii TaxID=1463999 RepID=UPI001901AAE7|nr:uncharacterized protein EAF02_010087 [Botrytis sinoallii]KAF7864119.1 hypothetical protein EAF02_010087 [Botrytis sinoallii]